MRNKDLYGTLILSLFTQKVPTINELIIREEDEDDLQLKPWLPEIRNEVEEKKSNALEKLMSKVKDGRMHGLHR